jgi:hypothetical protein
MIDNKELDQHPEKPVDVKGLNNNLINNSRGKCGLYSSAFPQHGSF